MNKNILVLYTGADAPVLVTQLAEAIARHGSTAIMRQLGAGLYDQVLDAVAIADTVMYWPPEIGP